MTEKGNHGLATTLKDHYFGKVNKFFVIRNLKKEDGFAMFRWRKSATRIKKRRGQPTS